MTDVVLTEGSPSTLEPETRRSVPFVDLRLQHRQVAAEVQVRMAEVLEAASFVLGPQVTQFEREYADFAGVRHCVGVGNGTDAIELALRGIALRPGDEVIIPANTFVATAEAVVRAGGRLVLADCDDDFLLDPQSVEDQRTARTRAVVGVSLYGQIPDLDAISSAVGDEVSLVEDGAQSQGARRWGQTSGSFGRAAATSFYPGKNLGAYGDAGAVTTQDSEVADRIRALRNHGGQKRYDHGQLGTNSRLDSLQAAVLSVKLRRLQSWNHERLVAARRYAELLSDEPRIVLPRTLAGNDHVWHLYVVRVPDRDRVLNELTQAGIGAGIHYPAPIHRLGAFSDLDVRPGALRRSEQFAQEILSLPMYPGITEDDQDYVVETLRTALG